ncbi:15-hydroxyprostaglandin dehydrogenase [Xylogone sp. PMI_703]|nr:15-hydroxyprostaglandin dehydrogenase [Xylogone sp. PMI_703]
MATTELKDKGVIVTGGASGIGLAVVNFFASRSSKIAILDISETAAVNVLADLKSQYPGVTFAFKKCDIGDWDNQKQVFEEVYQEFGNIQVVFANAGITERGEFVKEKNEEPTKPVLKTLDINLYGTLYSVKLAIHYMRKNTASHKGSIICTASNAGLYAFPMAPMYAASKAGIIQAVRSMGPLLEGEGITLNAIAPAVIKTGLADAHLFQNMILTPVSTAVSAIEDFSTQPGLNAKVAEISGEKYTIREQLPFVDEDTKKNLDTFSALGYA